MTGLTPFQKGSAPNPKGKTSEQRKMEVQNAETATRLRAMFLQAMEARLNGLAADGPEAAVMALTNEALRLIKESEDRGLGTPVQSVDLSSKDLTMSPAAQTDAVLAALARKHDTG